MHVQFAHQGIQPVVSLYPERGQTHALRPVRIDPVFLEPLTVARSYIFVVSGTVAADQVFRQINRERVLQTDDPSVEVLSHRHDDSVLDTEPVYRQPDRLRHMCADYKHRHFQQTLCQDVAYETLLVDCCFLPQHLVVYFPIALPL